MQTNLVKSS